VALLTIDEKGFFKVPVLLTGNPSITSPNDWLQTSLIRFLYSIPSNKPDWDTVVHAF
jgi:hypothetical protein